MIVRLVLAGFVSFVSGFCYLAGLLRLMSALLIGFGICSALFFGALFTLPPGDERLSFGVAVTGAAWPFFLLAAVLAGLIIRLFIAGKIDTAAERLGRQHFKYLGSGLLVLLASLFVPTLLWFPSEQELKTLPASSLDWMVFGGVAVFLVGASAALFLLYRASRGATDVRPDLMRRFVLALFAALQLDKLPVLVAYLLVYSTEPQLVHPWGAALALAGYVPVALFLSRLSLEAQSR